ncbi:MAG: response regulator [Spirochaetes bacterium]|nr:response regulator [Spirochaetota bacterium]MBN2770134.1 response regulator [Spirochaetota bacterium]
MNILIVEDKQEARYLLEVLLKSRGYVAVSASNGREGLQKLDNNKIDLIISDILMPEMDGFKFCTHVKADKNKAGIPFVFYTATYVDKRDEDFAMRLGADLFLRKPMEPEALLSEIDNVVERIKKGDYNSSVGKFEMGSDDKEVYKLYNERLVKKLEDKVGQLEKEVVKRQNAELKLKKMVSEKEILIKELYHRTKNNMQVISSMLWLYSNKILNEEWGSIVKNVNLKIRTMALVHQELYESSDLSHVNLKEFFKNLVVLLQKNYLTDGKVCEINTDMQDIRVLLDTAIPLGFVLNELITNALKHAFLPIDVDKQQSSQENSSGHLKQKGNLKNHRIDIKLYKGKESDIVLEVADNGGGLPEDFDFDVESHPGLLLMRDMVVSQLKGKVKYKTDNGLIWTVTIDHECYDERV